MKIDLSERDIFESNELELEKKITFIFGKNGTGKSTIAEAIKELNSDYEVYVFQGFNNIIDENHRLNAVVLGEENAAISRQIGEKKKEIKQKTEDIKKVQKNISKPEEGISNFWTRRNDAQIAYKEAKKQLDDFYAQSASKIKNKKEPQVSKTSYNKRNFQEDLKTASLLEKEEVQELLATIKSEVKIAADIVFPHINMENLLDDVNDILQKVVTERVKVQRLDDNSDKREFAKRGLELHKKGEICAFCGGKIRDEIFDELESYFSADEVKAFQVQIKDELEKIDLLIENVTNIQLMSTDFYPAYTKEVDAIKSEIDKIRKSHLTFLAMLKQALDDKQKYLFEERVRLEEKIPTDFSDIEAKYKKLKKRNNENDIESKKKEAIDKLRMHYVKEMMDEFGYDSEKAKVDILLAEKNQREEEYNVENDKIDAPNGLKEAIYEIQEEISQLQGLTKNESILAENINKKLNHMVTFKLEHFEDEESKGFYKIKNGFTGDIREITELSTGEKNIIAFLYFVEKLNEIKEQSDIKPRIIVFDDPMNSNDDGMQYLIIEELQLLMKKLLDTDYFILLTHNKHFYINVRYGHKYGKDTFLRLQSDGIKTNILVLSKAEDDFKTSYEALWSELKFLYESNATTADILLNPIRRIIETFTNFNVIRKTDFFSKVLGAKKLFNVNSHSIDDVEAELNGKTKQEIIQIFFDCFAQNGYSEHFLKYWKDAYVDENNVLIAEERN